MRSLQVQVRTDRAQRVLALAESHGARAPVAVQAIALTTTVGGDDSGWSVLMLNLPNDSVGRFVEAVADEAADASFVLMPVGTLPVATPLDRIDDSVRDVSTLSTLELVVSSLQSVGAWRGMLVYSVLAGIVAAYGLSFDVVYLLVAAMLINPMGAPAVVSVIGIAIGDHRMFARGGLRFLVSLVAQATAALALGLAYGLTVSTSMMEQVTSLSAWSAVLALAAGAAGAQAQLTSERDSLVSGTAAGFMVAAALAPPAAVLGLSVALGRWDYFELMAFQLLLQFVAIAAGGWVTLHLLGVRPADESIGRGSAQWRNVLAATVTLAVIGLAWLQSGLEPRFTKADLSRTALEVARDAVDQTASVALVESSAHFTRPEEERHSGEALLFDIVVERLPSGPPVDDDVETEIRERVRRLVRTRMSGVVPFVRVTVLNGPAGP
ncbi:hypothetical protein BH23GEM9_BH23GEM9_00290 [soil metagenome]